MENVIVNKKRVSHGAVDANNKYNDRTNALLSCASNNNGGSFNNLDQVRYAKATKVHNDNSSACCDGNDTRPTTTRVPVNTSEDGVFFRVSSHNLLDYILKNSMDEEDSTDNQVVEDSEEHIKRIISASEMSSCSTETDNIRTLSSSSLSCSNLTNTSKHAHYHPVCWNSTGTKSFLQNVPLLVTDPDIDDSEDVIPNAAQKLGQIISKSKVRLPNGPAQFASNHVMVNQERLKRCAAPLQRLTELDEIARQHAAAMAQADKLFHIDIETLCTSFHRYTTRRMGENIAKGTSIKEIHCAMIENSVSDRNNILDRRYTHMGMGTARCPTDGQLYLCQVFRG